VDAGDRDYIPVIRPNCNRVCRIECRRQGYSDECLHVSVSGLVAVVYMSRDEAATVGSRVGEMGTQLGGCLFFHFENSQGRVTTSVI